MFVQERCWTSLGVVVLRSNEELDVLEPERGVLPLYYSPGRRRKKYATPLGRRCPRIG